MVMVCWLIECWCHYDLWKGSNLGFPGISRRTHWGNGLVFCMLMYLVHPQNWVDYGHSRLILLILVLFWLHWMGQIWGFLVMLCGFSSLWYPFDSNWSYFGFLGVIWRTCGSKCQGGSGGIFPMLCIEFCLVYWYILCFINEALIIEKLIFSSTKIDMSLVRQFTEVIIWHVWGK